MDSQRSCFGYADHPRAMSVLNSQNTNKQNLLNKSLFKDSSRISHLKYKQAKYFKDQVLN